MNSENDLYVVNLTSIKYKKTIFVELNKEMNLKRSYNY